jgi:hypothetical protein
VWSVVKQIEVKDYHSVQSPFSFQLCKNVKIKVYEIVVCYKIMTESQGKQNVEGI